jgi:hypothetical protein
VHEPCPTAESLRVQSRLEVCGGPNSARCEKRKGQLRLAGWVARTRPRCSIGLELLGLGAFAGFRSTAILASIGTNPPMTPDEYRLIRYFLGFIPERGDSRFSVLPGVSLMRVRIMRLLGMRKRRVYGVCGAGGRKR